MKTRKRSKSMIGGGKAGPGRTPKPKGEKFIKTSISLHPDDLADAVELTNSGNHASVSAYITELIRCDKSGAVLPSLIDPEDSITALTGAMAPGLSRKLKEALEGKDIDQSAMLTEVLHAVIRHIELGGDSSKPLKISATK